MNLLIQIINAKWKSVFVIKSGSDSEYLQTEVYKEIRKAAGKINNRFLCYSWGSKSEVNYCGSVSRDYQYGSQKSNLEGRIRNYFRNHRQKENGRKNANLNVYEHIVSTLMESDVNLSILVFDEIRLGDKTFSYEEYSEKPELVQAVEQLIISSLYEIGLCQWNRTPSTRVKRTKQNNRDETQMNKKNANEIRAFIIKQYVTPNREKGIKEIHLRSGDIHKELELHNCMPNVCQVIDGDIFQKQARITQVTRKGPKQSSTVEWIFRLD